MATLASAFGARRAEVPLAPGRSKGRTWPDMGLSRSSSTPTTPRLSTRQRAGACTNGQPVAISAPGTRSVEGSPISTEWSPIWSLPAVAPTSSITPLSGASRSTAVSMGQTGRPSRFPAAPALGALLLPQVSRTIAFPAAGLIFAATQNQVWRFDQMGSTWTCTPIPTTNLPSTLIITALAVEDPSAGSFYVTVGGGGVDHVWYYDGKSWQSAGLSVSIVDAPAHAVAVDPASPKYVYVGIDVGCWRGTKFSEGNWARTLFSQGLPESTITDLGIH